VIVCDSFVYCCLACAACYAACAALHVVLQVLGQLTCRAISSLPFFYWKCNVYLFSDQCE